MVRGSKWLWTKTKAGGRRSKRWAIIAWNWSADHAVIGWNWLANTAAWGWSYVGPALRWTSTPVRIGLGAIFGFAAVQTVGPAIFGVLAISYLTYVLVTGRFGFGSREKTFKGDFSTIADEQRAAMMLLMAELEDSKSEVTSKTGRSSVAGQIQLVNARIQGDNSPVGQGVPRVQGCPGGEHVSRGAALHELDARSHRDAHRRRPGTQAARTGHDGDRNLGSAAGCSGVIRGGAEERSSAPSSCPKEDRWPTRE